MVLSWLRAHIFPYTEREADMWLFVGLGNPGDKYAKNRHNVGFMVADAVRNAYPAFGPYKSKFQGLMSEGRMEEGGQKVILLKPQTYMNESGQSVGKAAQFYKIDPNRIVVFHDELDIDPNTVRVKQGGGNAGHNGLKSIQAHLGTPDFWRVRIGIGHPGQKNAVHNYVLSDFSKAEQEWVGPLVETMGERADIIIRDNPKAYDVEIKGCIQKASPV